MRTDKGPQETALEIYNQYKDYLIIYHDYAFPLKKDKALPVEQEPFTIVPNLLASLLSISRGFPVFKPIGLNQYKFKDGLMPAAKMIEFITETKKPTIELIERLVTFRSKFTPYLSEVIHSINAICEHKELLIAEFESKSNFNSQTGYPGLICAGDIPCFEKFKQIYYQKRGQGFFASKEGMILLLQSGEISTLNGAIIYAKNNLKSRSNEILEEDLNINVKEASVVLDKSEVTKELNKLGFLVSDVNTIVVSYIR